MSTWPPPIATCLMYTKEVVMMILERAIPSRDETTEAGVESGREEEEDINLETNLEAEVDEHWNCSFDTELCPLPNCKVTKCGVRLLYTEDVESIESRDHETAEVGVESEREEDDINLETNLEPEVDEQYWNCSFGNCFSFLFQRDRNVILHDGRGLVLDQVWNDADSFTDDFLATNLPSASSPFCSGSGPDLSAFSFGWKAPPAAFFKLNVDASCDVLSGCSGLGVVVRNATEIVVFAAAVPLKFCADVEVAEAKAILAGIQLAAERGLLPLLVETDSLNVSRLYTNLCPLPNCKVTNCGVRLLHAEDMESTEICNDIDSSGDQAERVESERDSISEDDEEDPNLEEPEVDEHCNCLLFNCFSFLFQRWN
ncbi:hypothetical protein JRO89_XS08G0009300 [Xanthoceras sorbifolium]|uniref:RNase H type-1 domain-containing protein n=1 Tax=Xanthoceras sorbifolium TaxID=99658 RepID=A0ABQ8HN34_9ROSI|nr:hypothetical protein JRO89_XS08G0009300 [Xanthoceras sorbifolium]